MPGNPTASKNIGAVVLEGASRSSFDQNAAGTFSWIRLSVIHIESGCGLGMDLTRAGASTINANSES
jgi:hypothetical protein